MFAIMSKAAVSIHVQVFLWTYVFKSFGQPPRSVVAGHMSERVQFYKKLPGSPTVAVPSACPPAAGETSPAPSAPSLLPPLTPPPSALGLSVFCFGTFYQVAHEIYSHNTSSKIKLFKTLKVMTSEH